jgi:tRNA pseudouridine38-40 synthase
MTRSPTGAASRADAGLSGSLAAPGAAAGSPGARLRLDLSYDGSGFHGWSRQPGGLRTVQQVLEDALGLVLAQAGPLTVAGRTDAGVHARGQVAHLDLTAAAWPALRRAAHLEPAQNLSSDAQHPSSDAQQLSAGPQQLSAGPQQLSAGPQQLSAGPQQLSAGPQQLSAGPQQLSAGPQQLSPGEWLAAGETLRHRLAGLLPADVRVRAVSRAPGGFDARFSALWRRYSYRVCDDPAAADPLRRHDTLWYPRPVEVARMNQAAQACLGEHDFAAFCRRREGATTVRELLRLEWERPAPGVVVATVVADAFCHNMVRALVGGLLAVGDGRRPPGWLAGVLAAGVRDPAVHVAAPHGLCLEEVRYPPGAELAARAGLTRRLRR